jgi:hypothetical protein
MIAKCAALEAANKALEEELACLSKHVEMNAMHLFNEISGSKFLGEYAYNPNSVVLENGKTELAFAPRDIVAIKSDKQYFKIYTLSGIEPVKIDMVEIRTPGDDFNLDKIADKLDSNKRLLLFVRRGLYVNVCFYEIKKKAEIKLRSPFFDLKDCEDIAEAKFTQKGFKTDLFNKQNELSILEKAIDILNSS